jgi:LmbE family N-acetylglucosaminyl deacetylase
MDAREPKRKVLLVLAHPDDESMGNGTMIARHRGAGVEVHLVCITRGGAGWGGLPAGRRPEELPGIRKEELGRAAEVLDLASVALWDYPDGAVADCDQAEISLRIGRVIEQVSPDVIVGWGHDGGYGHPDHIAVGACTDAAVAGVAAGLPLYHMAYDGHTAAQYRRAFELAGANGDSLPLRWHPRVSVVFQPTEEELRTKAAAIACHKSQLQPWLVNTITRPEVLRLFGAEGYIRVGAEPAGAILRRGLFPELVR